MHDPDRLPQIDYNSLFRTAVHESAHALRAHHVGWPVHWLHATAAHNGAIGVVYPLSSKEVEAAYAQDPDHTHRLVVEVLSVLYAPGKVLNEPLDGSDLEDVLAYQGAWEKTRSPLGWLVLRHQAQQQVRTWANAPGRIRQIANLAGLLEQRGYISGGMFLAFVSPPQAKWPAPRPALRPVAPSRPALPR